MSADALRIINELERIGYSLTVVDGKVRGDRQDMLPPLPESAALLDVLRQHKSEVIDVLMCRKWSTIPPSEGDAYQVIFDGSDEGQRTRWRVAVREGLIALDGSVRFHRKDNTMHIAYHASLPEDWLQEDITAACKERYNAVLGRIRNGETWLNTHTDDPNYEAHFARLAALFDELGGLFNAVGKPLANPLIGY